jgi:hypothetical protein
MLQKAVDANFVQEDYDELLQKERQKIALQKKKEYEVELQKKLDKNEDEFDYFYPIQYQFEKADEYDL